MDESPAMNLPSRWLALIVAISFVAIGSLPLTVAQTNHSAESLPAASNVVQRLLDRVQLIAGAQQTSPYIYEKRSVTSELDEKERVLKSTEKLYRVEMTGGLAFSRLIKVQGRELTEQELEMENKRETAFRQKVTRIDLTKKAKKKEGLVTRELVDRFEFQITKRELIEDRPTLVMVFKPRNGAPVESMEDKVFMHVIGTVWVDEEDAEMTRLDVSLGKPVSLGWFGAIGSLNKFQATVDRSRMPDGVWVTRKSTFRVLARKLVSWIRTKTTEESSGFRKE